MATVDTIDLIIGVPPTHVNIEAKGDVEAGTTSTLGELYAKRTGSSEDFICLGQWYCTTNARTTSDNDDADSASWTDGAKWSMSQTVGAKHFKSGDTIDYEVRHKAQHSSTTVASGTTTIGRGMP